MTEQPPSSPSVDAVAPAAAAAAPVCRQYSCADDASIKDLVSRVSTQERAHVLRTLGPSYTAAFHTTGFCEKRPVQIVSPFDLEPGPQRKEFLDVFAEHEASGTLDKMPHLVYWFDASLQQGAPHVTLEQSGAIMSYEVGERLNYDQVPKEVSKKLVAHGEAHLTAEELVNCKALVALDKARDSGAAAMKVEPDDVIYKVVRASELMLPTPNTLKKKTETAADALIEMMGPQRQQKSNKKMPKVDDRVKVYWETLETYFYGFVHDIRGDFYFIIYDDEETQWLPLSDHRFEIVPDSEHAVDTPPSRDPDPRWFADSPRKSPSPQKRQTKVKFADDDEDSETEWQGNLASGGKKKKNNGGRKKQQGKSGKDPATRYFKNGLWIMKQSPSKDSKGFYRRPVGRAPAGFEWDRRNGWYAPEKEPLVGKRKNSSYDTTLPVKAAKQAGKKKKFVDDASDDDSLFGKHPAAASTGDDWWTKKEVEEATESFKIPRRVRQKEADATEVPRRKSPPPEAGQASAEEGGSPKTNQGATLAPIMPQKENGDAKLAEAEGKGEVPGTVTRATPDSPAWQAAKLHTMLLSLGNNASAAKIKQVQEMMTKLAAEDELSLTKDIRKLIQKPVKELTNHIALGEVARSLSLQLRAGYYAKLMVDLKRAVDNKQTNTVKQKVLHLYKKIFEGSKPLKLDEEFIIKHNLLDLVLEISLFFNDQGVVLTELGEIENQLNESVELEDNADI